MTTTDADTLAQSIQERYVAMWNESDTARRHALVDELFADDVLHRLLPPAEMRAEARRLGFANPTLDVVGHAEMRFRADQAFEEFVAPGTYEFRAVGRARIVGSTLLVRWQMVDVASSNAVGGGLDVLTLDTAARIRTDHQFIDP